MKYLIGAFFGLFMVIGLIISPLIAYNTKQAVSFTVNDKAVTVSDKTSTYLIYTDNGVFKDEDSLWYWKWNSSDVYNVLERGKSYRADVYGFRVPFLSMYKNIIVANPTN